MIVAYIIQVHCTMNFCSHRYLTELREAGLGRALTLRVNVQENEKTRFPHRACKNTLCSHCRSFESFHAARDGRDLRILGHSGTLNAQKTSTKAKAPDFFIFSSCGDGGKVREQCRTNKLYGSISTFSARLVRVIMSLFQDGLHGVVHSLSVFPHP